LDDICECPIDSGGEEVGTEIEDYSCGSHESNDCVQASWHLGGLFTGRLASISILSNEY